ncbi:PsiF family protein [Chitinimonas sp. BJB300]|uniref:PsiF family protein n=1 Tax=Chitinimonas sp. BJB300 TaxID=1559339 RepID=UPI000C0DEEA7|nr:PsiF family protein [Chitinimonas sp. BJB300]PHV10163.1 phosphate starvation-inducible protein PsiF [Chitinimonas sp. BJB300]TSJ87840.1 phosphate starvation-inducible protein PsiF [Chitinimonas sp. BJB300]
MLRLTLITTLLLTFGVGTGYAADEVKEPNKQQNKMAECNKAAVDKKGDERKSFMRECLKSKQKIQQNKMKECNAEAGTKELKGPERKQFMSECLKK